MSDGKKTLELSFEDRLKGVLYNYMTLLDQWKKQGEVDVKRNESFLKLLQALKEEIEGFSHLQSNVENSLKEMMKELTKLSIQHIKSGVIDSIHSDLSVVKKQIADFGYQTSRIIDDSKQSLSESVQNACDTLNSVSRYNLIKTFAIAIIGCVAASLITVKLIMPAPRLALTENDINTYQDGLVFEKAWLNLSNEQKEQFLSAVKNSIKK